MTLQRQLEHRLSELKSEYESGRKFLSELEAKQASVNETLLRIAGAIQVLEEELGKANDLPKYSEGQELGVDTAPRPFAPLDGAMI
ncbi:MAG: hypothetical protein VKK04_25325 [Synechococcales bacterium]|nr:hypothetical protein [Synechococcales bacterium]